MNQFFGEIKMFATTYAPCNWAFCWGQTYPIQEYSILYSLIGTLYGGDGRRIPGQSCCCYLRWQVRHDANHYQLRGPGIPAPRVGRQH